MIDENVVSGVDGVDHDVKKSRRGVVMKEEGDLESDGEGGGFDLLGGGGGEVDDDLEDVTPDIKQIKQEETKPQVTSLTTKQAFLLDIFPHAKPTPVGKTLSFFRKFLEFILKILEFSENLLEFSEKIKFWGNIFGNIYQN